jgi:hypothetical protein
MLLPSAAACVLAYKMGIHFVADLISIAILTLGLLGFSTFWITLLSHTAGIIYSYAILLISLAGCLFGIVNRHQFSSVVLRQLILCWALLTLAALFVTSVGFLYSDVSQSSTIATTRFTEWPLPADNVLPKLFADEVFQSHIERPMYGDWLSSDRPPLQAGLVLWHYAWTRPPRDLEYQVIATILQLTSIIALWGYLTACNINPRARALVLLVVLGSGFTLVNCFYVWPKFLPVTFLLVVATFLLSPKYFHAQNRWSIGLVTGTASGLAMLSHGGSMFALLGLGITLLLMRRIPSRRFILAATIAALVVYGPWMLYQKYYDPPGDRLLKWHLAGVIPPHPESSFTDLLIRSYSRLTYKQILANKAENFEYLAAGTASFWRTGGVLLSTAITHEFQKRAIAIASLKSAMFFHWLTSLDLLVFGLLALPYGVVSRDCKTAEFSAAWILFLWIGTVLVVWCLVMFGPATTYVHQGSYLTNICAFTGLLLALWAVRPTLAYILGILHVLFNISVYVFMSPISAAGSAFAGSAPNRVLGWTSAMAAAGIVIVSWRLGAPVEGRES